MNRVLILDPDAAFRLALAFMLDEQKNMRVVAQAGTLAQARASFMSTPIDSALIDIDMPGGLELIRELREAHLTTIMVALTEDVQPEKRMLAINAGADEMLAKSTTASDIAGMLGTLWHLRNEPPSLDASCPG